ncbi:MAG: 3'-5' exonuclease [Patescibacteria group bacterium]
MHLIFLDTETTGNDVTKDRLCQLCYKTEKGGIKVGYFKPPLPISIKAMSVTHITNKMVEDKESFEGSEMKKDLQTLFKEGVLIAHNCKFDSAILEAEGMEIPQSICTLRVARFLDTKGVISEYNLQYLRYYLDVDVPGNAHDAEGDVNVLEQVFKRLLAKVREGEESDEAAIDKMIEISSKPSLYRIFNFGKYKDKAIEEVVKTDKGYLEWLLNQKITSGENDEDWIYTLQYYLKK